jgi:hypothetical protein
LCVPPAIIPDKRTNPNSRYQFNNDLYNPDVVVNVLLKALTQTQNADFNLCLSLLDDRPPTAQLDEPDPLPTLLPQIIALHALIQQCRFPAFWATFNSDELSSIRENYTVEVVGFEDAVRDAAVRAVKATFTRIGAARLGSYLNLEGQFCNVDRAASSDARQQVPLSTPMSQNSDGHSTMPLNRSQYRQIPTPGLILL